MKLLPLIALLALLPAASLLADINGDVDAARAAYEKSGKHDEAARVAYVTRLATILGNVMTDYITTGHRREANEFDLLYAELRGHPAPANSDTGKFRLLRTGKWQSPRHDYIARADGTWSMLPADPGATAGRWRIEGNRYYENANGEDARAPYTIILLDKNYFIFSQGDYVFYQHRLGK